MRPGQARTRCSRTSAVVLTDNDGDVASGDAVGQDRRRCAGGGSGYGQIAAGLSGFADAATGNVITMRRQGMPATPTPVADARGADGAVVTSIVATTAASAATVVGTNTVVNGQYGVLTISAHRRLFVCAQCRFAGRRERRVHLHADRRRRRRRDGAADDFDRGYDAGRSAT